MRSSIQEEVLQRSGTGAFIILDMCAVGHADTTGAGVLQEAAGAAWDRGVVLLLAAAPARTRDVLARSGFEKALGESRLVPVLAPACIPGCIGHAQQLWWFSALVISGAERLREGDE